MIQWKGDEACPQLEQPPESAERGVPGLTGYRIARGVGPGEIRFGPLGYARHARESFASFSRLQSEGVVPSRLRFQVSIPTPLAPVWAFVGKDENQHLLVEPAWERAIAREIDEIAGTIPRCKLAIQWDVAIDMVLYDGIFPHETVGGRGAILERLVRYAGLVPPEVDLGYHLCYGDVGHQHFRDPESFGRCVEVANALGERVARSVEWIMMPVPRSQSANPGYFRPLGQLELREETALYLGLIHYTDGLEGALGCIDLARRFVRDFGISTECGFGRRDPETIPDLLRLHAAVAGAG
jgi:hypothetical protein